MKIFIQSNLFSFSLKIKKEDYQYEKQVFEETVCVRDLRIHDAPGNSAGYGYNYSSYLHLV